jgi:hypothetical protein
MTSPQINQWAGRHLADLGVYLGLEHRLLSGSLRRRAAYLLAMNYSEEERKSRMGHKDRDSVYWSHYRNEDLTNDFQAIVHAVEAENLEIMGSIALNRKEEAPRYPSNAGVLVAFQEPELVKLLEEKSELYDQIIQMHQSISRAKELDQDLFKKHQAAANKVQACRRRLLRVQFRKEYQDFFQREIEVASVLDIPAKDIPGPGKSLPNPPFTLNPALGGTPLPPPEVFFESQLEPASRIASGRGDESQLASSNRNPISTMPFAEDSDDSL